MNKYRYIVALLLLPLGMGAMSVSVPEKSQISKNIEYEPNLNNVKIFIVKKFSDSASKIEQDILGAMLDRRVMPWARERILNNQCEQLESYIQNVANLSVDPDVSPLVYISMLIQFETLSQKPVPVSCSLL
ncbi:MAG: hypothetical protein WD449_02870 [Candidatus Babeliales bacterium]